MHGFTSPTFLGGNGLADWTQVLHEPRPSAGHHLSKADRTPAGTQDATGSGFHCFPSNSQTVSKPRKKMKANKIGSLSNVSKRLHHAVITTFGWMHPFCGLILGSLMRKMCGPKTVGWVYVLYTAQFKGVFSHNLP